MKEFLMIFAGIMICFGIAKLLCAIGIKIVRKRRER